MEGASACPARLAVQVIRRGPGLVARSSFFWRRNGAGARKATAGPWDTGRPVAGGSGCPRARARAEGRQMTSSSSRSSSSSSSRSVLVTVVGELVLFLRTPPRRPGRSRGEAFPRANGSPWGPWTRGGRTPGFFSISSRAGSGRFLQIGQVLTCPGQRTLHHAGRRHGLLLDTEVPVLDESYELLAIHCFSGVVFMETAAPRGGGGFAALYIKVVFWVNNY